MHWLAGSADYPFGRFPCLVVLAALTWPLVAWSQDPPSAARSSEQAPQTLPAAVQTVAEREKPSPEAERIARTYRSIDTTRKLVLELQAKLDDPEGEYHKFQEAFVAADGEYQEKKKQLEDLKAAGNTEEALELETELVRVERKWRLIKERFELKIEERKQLVGQLESLRQKLAKDQETLDRLIAPSKPSAESEPTSAPATAVVEAESAAKPPASASTSALTPLLPALPLAGTAEPEASSTAASSSVKPMAAATDSEAEGPRSKELVEAVERASQKLAEADAAEKEAHSITERIRLLEESVKAARALRATTLKQVDNADKSVQALEAAIQRRTAEEATPEQLHELQTKLQEARQRLSTLRAESRERADRLDQMQTELAQLQSEQIRVLRDAEQRRLEAEVAQKHLADLQNPFTPRNVIKWLLDHGPPILAIVLAMGALVWLARCMEARLVDLVARRGGRGGVEERENRAKTLVGVFRNAATMLIIAGGILMLLDETGVPIGPLMGGAAVLGLAVAFGAQSLIKDFFSGFMILLEQQYMVNDVIKIGDVSGQVERITLRTTVLRDLEGRVHFIPHGQITSTTNMTHGWSRALFEISLGYKEDANRAMEELLELGRQLRRDPEFGPLILEDPVMLGVDSFGEFGFTVKFYLKTRPLRQWPVKRELLRRIKTRFDELGVEIPYPHRTIVHKTSDSRNGGQTDLPGEWSRQVA